MLPRTACIMAWQLRWVELTDPRSRLASITLALILSLFKPKRRITAKQWGALAVLMLGMGLVQGSQTAPAVSAVGGAAMVPAIGVVRSGVGRLGCQHIRGQYQHQHSTTRPHCHISTTTT